MLDYENIQSKFPHIGKHNENDVIEIKVGNLVLSQHSNPFIIAGPCSAESYDQVRDIASHLKTVGVEMFRAGIYKMRTSPTSFQGLGEEAIEILKKIKAEYQLLIVSEITEISQLEELEGVVDIFQVGTRNMYNYPLLSALGKQTKPVILKRGLSATIDEWLYSAEYIAKEGNLNIILCERGIRSFENYTRFTLDLNSASLVRKMTKLPVIVDPSHSTGRYDLVEDMSLAAIAAGVDGLIVEVHNNPECALSDSHQSINFKRIDNIIKKTKEISKIVRNE